jgi:hypothetical protein
LKLIESTLHQPRAAAPLALLRGAPATGMAESWEAPEDVVLTAPPSSGRSPFLAQYLAQEFVAPDGQPSLWQRRDSAYRLAGTQQTAPQFSLDV